jgi:hypothetical protein
LVPQFIVLGPSALFAFLSSRVALQQALNRTLSTGAGLPAAFRVATLHNNTTLSLSHEALAPITALLPFHHSLTATPCSFPLMFAYHHPHHAPAPGPAQAPPASHAINSNNIPNNNNPNNSSTNQQTAPMLPPTMPPDAAVAHPMAWGSAGYTTAPGLQPYAYMHAASYPPLPPPPPTNAIGASGHQLAFGQWFPMAPSAPAPPLAPPFGAPGLLAFAGPFVTYPTASLPLPPPPAFGVVPQMYAPGSAVPVWPHAAMASAPVGPSADLGPGFVYPPTMPSASPSAVPAAFDNPNALPLSHQHRRPPTLQLAVAAPIQGAVSIHVAPSQNAAAPTAAATGDAHRISHTDSRTSTPQSLRSTTSMSSNSAMGRVQGESDTTPLTPPAHAPVSVRPIALDPNLVRAPPPAGGGGGGGGGVGDSGGILVDRFRTRPCRNHRPAPGKQCPYRSRCMFAHGDEELRTSAMNFRDGLFTEAAIRTFQEVESARRRRRGAGAVAVTASVTSSSTRDNAPTGSGLSDQVSPYSTISDSPK